ncbi:MAG: aldo/keto reductase [Acidobacteria bacterium]|nr:aldo/keto reductase [Acidobacteriota bacterium]
MKTVRLGTTGLEVSRLTLGCMTYGDPGWRSWILDEGAARDHFRRALDLGINFFDTANMYSRGVSEEITGKMLRELAHREDYVLASKVYFPVAKGPNRGGLSRKHILAACDASLKRLGLDYVDLYQIHRFDHETPIEETIEALDSLVKAGKVRYLGASSMAAWEFATMLFTADAMDASRFVSMQNHMNLAYREEEREMVPLCLDQGIGLIPWSPLARGFLAGNRTRSSRDATPRARDDSYADRLYYEEADFKVLDTLIEVAARLGERPAKVALAWLLSVPGVDSAIVGTTRIEQLEELAAAVDLTLDEETIAALEAPYIPHPVLGHDQPAPRD